MSQASDGSTEGVAAVLLRAAHYAADKHRDQRRRGSHATPYINHPLEVAERLATLGRIADVETLVAAVLHDALEDTDASAGEIERLFGSRVRSLVEEVTDDGSLPKEERKHRQVATARGLTTAAKLIRLSDKISNVSDMGQRPPDWPLQRKRDYLDWAERVVAALGVVHPALDAEFHRVLARSRQKIEE